MRFRYLSSVFCVILLVMVYPAAGDDSAGGNWRAWLHDGDGHMTLVDASGAVLREIDLPHPDNLPDVSWPVVSSDGELITYLAMNPRNNAQQRMLYDSANDSLLEFEYIKRDESSTLTVSAVFDPDNRLLAYSTDQWFIQVADVLTGSIRFQLDATSPDLPELFQNATDVKTIVWRFADGRVWFTAQFAYINVSLFGYVWNLGTGQVTRSEAYADIPADTFAPTGETLSLDLIAPQTGNSRVMVYDPLLGGRFTFYTNPELELIDRDLRFVHNGQLVLVHGQAGSEDIWLLLERDGSLAGLLRHAERRTIFGTAEGFVYTLVEDDTTQLVEVDTSRFLSDRVVWHSQGRWQIVWVDSGADAYGPFKAWAMLDEPVYDAPVVQSQVTPTPFPPGPQLLNPGMLVYVITNGDVLYLRDKPGTGGAILLYLYDRDRVLLLEGPVEVDGFRWWRVRAKDGTEGWAAEASGDVSTLLPETPEPPRITPTPTPTTES